MTNTTNFSYCHLPRAPVCEEIQQALNVLRAGDATSGEQTAIHAKASAMLDRLRPLEIAHIRATADAASMDPACAIEGGVVAPAVLLTRRAHLREGRL